MIRATTRVRIRKCTEYDVYGNEARINYKVEYQKKFLWIPYWVTVKRRVNGYMGSWLDEDITFSDVASAEKYIADERKKVGESTMCQIVKEV